MIVQWCLKGLRLESDAEADRILDSHCGLLSNWFRGQGRVLVGEIGARLTHGEVDRHVNHFGDIDQQSGKAYSEMSPFISLTCGTVERLPALATNRAHRALQTALWFGSDFGRTSRAYVFVCWVLVAPRPTPEVEAVAEEVRDLTQYRRYSAFQTEGEILAKVRVPDNHLRGYEVWDRGVPSSRTSFGLIPGTGSVRRWTRSGMRVNPRFVDPTVLTNVRELIQ